MEIRLLKPTESAAYRQIRLDSLQQYPERFCSKYEDQVLKNKLGFQLNIEAKDRHKFVVGAFLKEKIVGICAFSCESETAQIGELVQMYVQKAAQGQGIARQLIELLCKTAFSLPNLQRIELEVLKLDENPKRLYQKTGFLVKEESEISLLMERKRVEA